MQRAASRSELFQQLGRYTETHGGMRLESFWGDIKPIYMRCQHNKCVYCETPLEGGAYGRIQWDLEHFRPKKLVRSWEGPKDEVGSPLTYDFPLGADLPDGYYLLSYAINNYAAACQTCNTCLKGNYFPIAGDRVQAGFDPAAYQTEQPFLVYPLGTADPDPADLIAFDGAAAVPRYTMAANPTEWRRAQVIIDFFDLNRESLQNRRARWLYTGVWYCWESASNGNLNAASALEYLQSERSEFSNCTRCFVDLLRTDFPKAQQMMAVVHETLVSS